VFLVLPSLQNLGTFKMLRFSFEPLGYERCDIYKKHPCLMELGNWGEEK
jgi:hypothetical protein